MCGLCGILDLDELRGKTTKHILKQAAGLLLDDHASGHRSHVHRLWLPLTFEWWICLFTDPLAPAAP